MAEKKLSARQIRFVEFYCSGIPATEAYIKAGYKGDPQKNAWIIQENSGVREAIDEKLNVFINNVDDKIKQSANDALDKALLLMTTAESEMVRLRASQDILDRAGLKALDRFTGKLEHRGEIALIDGSGNISTDDESPLDDETDNDKP